MEFLLNHFGYIALTFTAGLLAGWTAANFLNKVVNKYWKTRS